MATFVYMVTAELVGQTINEGFEDWPEATAKMYEILEYAREREIPCDVRVSIQEVR